MAIKNAINVTVADAASGGLNIVNVTIIDDVTKVLVTLVNDPALAAAASVSAAIYAAEAKTARDEAIELTETAMYSKQVDASADGSVIYIGEATAGTAGSAALWRIKKLTFTSVDGEDVSIQWASGTSLFDKIWNDRLSLTYT
jgi:hypothetical protein